MQARRGIDALAEMRHRAQQRPNGLRRAGDRPLLRKSRQRLRLHPQTESARSR